jgi:hypothetical protein
MADDDVVRTRGRPTTAFIAWARRLGFKPSRRRRYPELQCPSTTTGHRWACLAEEVADGPVGPARCVQNDAEHEAASGRRAWGADAEAAALAREQRGAGARGARARSGSKPFQCASI